MEITVTVSLEEFDRLRTCDEELKKKNEINACLQQNAQYLFKESINQLLKHFDKKCSTHFIDGNYKIPDDYLIEKSEVTISEITEGALKDFISVSVKTKSTLK